jgi:hypothetical protein
MKVFLSRGIRGGTYIAKLQSQLKCGGFIDRAGDIMRAQRLAHIFIPALTALALSGSAQSRYEYPRDDHIEFACPPGDRPAPQWTRPRPPRERERGVLNAEGLLVALLTGALGFALGRITR